jgi:uncharacterized protein YaiI (UPF0178 family)
MDGFNASSTAPHQPERFHNQQISIMKIWVDADACPNVIKDILCRAAERTRVTVTFVANQEVRVPPSRFIRAVRVAPGFDVADHAIANAVEAGDLVITADIPLAALVVENGAEALNPRGERYTADNIRQRLTMRNFMEELRSSGVDIGGPAGLSQADRQEFANQLDRLLRRHEQGGI